MVNPGDEVIVFDPYFVMYRNLVALAGGTLGLRRHLPRLPDRRRAGRGGDDAPDQVRPGQQPGQPDRRGRLGRRDATAWPSSAGGAGVLLISDEVYRSFCYDRPFATPASWNDEVLVVDGFSKSHGMTGWRLGYAHGPARLIQEMAKLQQFSFVCAPSMVQHAGVAALDVDLTAQVDAYRRKRDAVVAALSGRLRARPIPRAPSTPSRAPPGGPRPSSSPRPSSRNLLIIPGNVFSRRDTHFRISYAVDDATLARGLDVLSGLAEGRPQTASQRHSG